MFLSKYLFVKILKEKHGLDAGVINCCSLKPLDTKMLKSINIPYFTLEEHMITGGFGQYVRECCSQLMLREPEYCFGINDVYIQHGNHSLLMKDAGIDAQTISDKIDQMIRRKRQ